MCGRRGHYSVVIGLESDKVVLEDPSSIGRGYIGRTEFLERWHDRDREGRRYEKYGIMVSGKPVVFNSSALTYVE